MKWRLIPLFLIGSCAFAIELVEVSFEQNVRRAQVVVIGVVEQAQPHVNNVKLEPAQIKVESVLKGTAPSIIRLDTHGRMAEEAFVVTAGRRFMFLLESEKSDKGVYFSVNGKFGVIPMDGKPLYP